MDNVLKTDKPFSWLGGVNEEGVIVEPGHELRGQSLAGKELHFPGASGSTVGSDVLINLSRKGYAPTKIVMERRDPITTWGSVFSGVPLEIKGKKSNPIDKSEIEKLDIDPELLDYILRASDHLEFKEFIPVRDPVQISGVSYKTIKDVGMELREDLSKRFKFKADAILNPAGMDLVDWRNQKTPEDFAEKQERIIRNYEKMGAEPTCTCTPYYSGGTGIPFSDGFWSESSAVAFANSVLGIKTNRESSLSALLWALTGYGPRYGLHLNENRNPQVEIDVKANLETTSDFGALGNFVGEVVKDKVPYLTRIKNPSLDKLKSLGAAAAASGSLALYHVEGFTPEAIAGTISLGDMEHIEITDEDLSRVKERLNTGSEKDVSLVAIGCPHASTPEIREVAKLLKGKRVKDGVDLCVYTSRATKAWCDEFGYTSAIEKAGGRVCCDTCMIVQPIEEMGYGTTATNSGKAARYLPSFCKQKVVFGDTKSIIDKVTRN